MFKKWVYKNCKVLFFGLNLSFQKNTLKVRKLDDYAIQ